MHFTTELCPSSHSSKCSSLCSSQGSSLCFVEPLYPALGPPDTVLVLLALRQYLPFTLLMLALAILFILGILKVPNYHVLEAIKQDFFFSNALNFSYQALLFFQLQTYMSVSLLSTNGYAQVHWVQHRPQVETICLQVTFHGFPLPWKASLLT